MAGRKFRLSAAVRADLLTAYYLSCELYDTDGSRFGHYELFCSDHARMLEVSVLTIKRLIGPSFMPHLTKNDIREIREDYAQITVRRHGHLTAFLRKHAVRLHLSTVTIRRALPT